MEGNQYKYNPDNNKLLSAYEKINKHKKPLIASAILVAMLTVVNYTAEKKPEIGVSYGDNHHYVKFGKNTTDDYGKFFLK